MNANYENKGVDQLARVINLIKKNPDDRRIIMSAWNPTGMYQRFYFLFTMSSCEHYVGVALEGARGL